MWGYSRVVDGTEEFVTKMALCFRVKCLVFSVFAVEREYGGFLAFRYDGLHRIVNFIVLSCLV